MKPNVYLYILVMAGVTYLIRMLPLVLFKREITSPFVKSFLYYVPYACLAAMTFPAILTATPLDSLAVHFPNKEVMIVETAAYYSHENDRWAKSADEYSEFYPVSAEGQRIFTRELVAELRRHANVTGLFWWFPEENASGNTVTEGWLNRGLFDNHTGKVLPAMEELRRFVQPIDR